MAQVPWWAASPAPRSLDRRRAEQACAPRRPSGGRAKRHAPGDHPARPGSHQARRHPPAAPPPTHLPPPPPYTHAPAQLQTEKRDTSTGVSKWGTPASALTSWFRLLSSASPAARRRWLTLGATPLRLRPCFTADEQRKGVLPHVGAERTRAFKPAAAGAGAAHPLLRLHSQGPSPAHTLHTRSHQSP